VVVVRVLLDFEENNRFEGNNYKVHARDLAAGLFGLNVYIKPLLNIIKLGNRHSSHINSYQDMENMQIHIILYNSSPLYT